MNRARPVRSPDTHEVSAQGRPDAIGLYSERFHGLLTLRYGVLFNFPSRYLFTIGSVDIFSLRSSLRPA